MRRSGLIVQMHMMLDDVVAALDADVHHAGMRREDAAGWQHRDARVSVRHNRPQVASEPHHERRWVAARSIMLPPVTSGGAGAVGWRGSRARCTWMQHCSCGVGYATRSSVDVTICAGASRVQTETRCSCCRGKIDRGRDRPLAEASERRAPSSAASLHPVGLHCQGTWTQMYCPFSYASIR